MSRFFISGTGSGKAHVAVGRSLRPYLTAIGDVLPGQHSGDIMASRLKISYYSLYTVNLDLGQALLFDGSNPRLRCMDPGDRLLELAHAIKAFIPFLISARHLHNNLDDLYEVAFFGVEPEDHRQVCV